MFINRENGKITGAFYSCQYYGQEWLEDDDEELISFLNNPKYGWGLSDIKANKCFEINQAHEQARIDEGAEFNSDLFDIDEKSQSNITAIVGMLVALNVPDEYKTTYRSKTNKNHELTKIELIQLGVAIGNKVSEIYQKSWDLKAQVDKATTKEEVEAITWK